MKKQDVEKLVTSVRQAGQVWRNEIRAGREYNYRPAGIKAILE